MHQSPASGVQVKKAPAAIALDLELVTQTDLLRLKAIARLHARGLPPDINWSDLLQEAFTRVLSGSRRQPEGLPMVVFVAGVMRSIRAEYWRRARMEARVWPKPQAGVEGDIPGDEIHDPTPSPERCLIAIEEMAGIDRLFADDDQARQVIAGLREDRSPDDICAVYGMSRTDYDSTRRRMRRVLLREGLRSSQS